MKLFRNLVIFLFFVLCCPKISFAQDTSQYKLQENFKREIIIGDKRFRVYNNWFSGGGGLGINTEIPYVQTVIAVNLNFHIRRYYFRLGGMMTGDNFGQWNNYQLHAGWIPYRKETEKYNLAMLGGISYLTGYKFVGIDQNHLHVYNTAHPYAVPGGYAEIQYIRKIYYDAGIGGAIFVNVNDKNTIVGIRADLYLSGAYKGYVKGREPHKPQ
jgi:hypothetical protein